MSDQPNMLEWALMYAGLGWKVFPVSKTKTPLTTHGFKDATIEEEQIQQWWSKWPTVGIGVATGLESGIVVLDIDDKPNALESVHELVQKKGEFSESIAARSGGGGYHIYFKHPGPGRHVPSVVGLFGYNGIDVRGDGGYIIVPPSPHLSKKRYEWGEGQSPFERELSDCPPYLYESRPPQAVDWTSAIEDGARNSTLTSLAGVLRSMGLEFDEILLVLQRQNELRCTPPLAEGELRGIAEGIMKYPPRNTRQDLPQGAQPRTILSFPATDAGHAELLGWLNMGRIKYNHETDHWLIWKNHWWETDKSGQITQLAIGAVRQMAQAGKDLIQNEDERIAFLKYARRQENSGPIQAMINFAQSLPSIATHVSDWNPNPDLFGVANGVVNLKTGDFRNGSPDDCILFHSPLIYNPKAQCPRWLAFLDEVFEGKKEVINFVHRAIGYSITGHTREQVMFLMVGNGANGKTKLIQVLRWLAGQYGIVLPFSTFERTPNGQAQTNDLASLPGKRIIISSESNEGVSINEARLKSLVGGGEITARFLHREFFTFLPVGKIWVATNHAPRVHDDSDGFWRRVLRIDFPVKFEMDLRGSETSKRRRADQDLDDKLISEMDGILAWAIQGAKLWYESGLQKPQTVLKSTQTYRQDSDPLSDFMTNHLEEGPEFELDVDVAYRAYVNYAREKQLKAYEFLPSARFHARLAKEFQKTQRGRHTFYQGIQLVKGSERLANPENFGTINITRVSRN